MSSFEFQSKDFKRLNEWCHKLATFLLEFVVLRLAVTVYKALQQFPPPLLCLYYTRMSSVVFKARIKMLYPVILWGCNTALSHGHHLAKCKCIFCKWNLTCHRAEILRPTVTLGCWATNPVCYVWNCPVPQKEATSQHSRKSKKIK